MPQKSPRRSRFLNVDLDLECDQGLDGLLDALSPHVVFHHRSSQKAAIELGGCSPKSIDHAIHEFRRLVAELPPDQRRIWDHCSVRNFDVGFNAGSRPDQSHFTVSLDALAALVEMGGTLVITIYGA